MEGTINFFQALCGDCISISWNDTEGHNHHIIIDAGYTGTYQRTLGKFLRGLRKDMENIDLFIITHTDNDHIGGIQPFIREFGESDFVKKFWFNWSNISYRIIAEDTKVSLGQGIELREYLRQMGKLEPAAISSGKKISMAGANIIVLSPNAEKFEKFKAKWGEKEKLLIEREYKSKVSKDEADDSIPIELLINRPFVEDNSIENGSSISILFSLGNFSILLLGDSHPSVIVEELKKIGYSEKHRIKVNMVKVSHHGSKGNTSPDLLALIDCEYYVISANGSNIHNLPNKETLSKICHNRLLQNSEASSTFVFTYYDKRFLDMFPEWERIKYKINFLFPDTSENCFSINFGKYLGGHSSITWR